MGKGKELGTIYCDEDVAHRVEEFLSRQHFPTIQQLGIVVEQGELTVRGCVESFYEKQVAMTVCQQVPGVLMLVDEIEVA